jgi:branched-subunit amino acid ABC-type transport system permease component
VLSQSILNGLIAGCEYGLVAAGLALVYQVRSFFHLAHGAVCLTSAYAANLLIVEQHWPPQIGIPAAILWGAALGVLMELAVYRPLVRRGASSTILLIASLGLLITLQSIVAFLFGSFTRSFFAEGVDEGLLVGGLRVTAVQLVTIAVFAAAAALLWLWMFRTKTGKEVRAVADNAQLSVAFGIDSGRVILLVFAVGSALAATAGILAGYNTNIFPTMGFWGILPAVVAIVVGGLGSISGAFLGAMFVGIVQNLAAWFLPTVWTNAIMFVVLLGFLLFRPTGLVGVALPNTRT